MARIASLFNLSPEAYEDLAKGAEIESKLPEALKKSKMAKAIVNFYVENGNKASKREEIVAANGWPQAASMASTFKEMQRSGLVVNTGLSHPKQEKPSVVHHADRFEGNSPEKKLELVIYRLKNSTKSDDNNIHSTWFVTNYGEENWSKLKQLVNIFKSAVTKEAGLEAKHNLKAFLKDLGFKFKNKVAAEPKEPIVKGISKVPEPTYNDDDIDTNIEPQEFDDNDFESEEDGEDFGGAY